MWLEDWRKKNSYILTDVMKLYKEVEVADKGLVWNTDLVEALELENLIFIFFVYSFKTRLKVVVV